MNRWQPNWALMPAVLQQPEGLLLLIGNLVPDGTSPVAQAYSGHQFGSFNPRLGDGRALLLGELTDASGRLRDVHLKGSGPHPVRPRRDGFAVVGPMLREYIVSEAMHSLGIPTTRSPRRDRDGPPGDPGDGAARVRSLTRVAASHLRVGSFQYARITDDADLLRRLADHAVGRHYPEAAEADNPYLSCFRSVVAAQASLVAQWMLVGFIHGVMNTDNMTISGETIDYGPCAFLDAFDPATVYSSIDQGGRYAYANQPLVAEWNLARLAETLLPLLHDDQERAVELAVDSLDAFRPQYSAAWLTGMKAKLGLREDVADDVASPLADDLLTLLQKGPARLHVLLPDPGRAAGGDAQPARALFPDPGAIDAWLERWRAWTRTAG
jgi:uncharacterized protein YdiU (UPF0061 family)